MEELKSIKLLGIKVTTEKEESILKYIVSNLQKGGRKLFVTTPNPEIIMYAADHPEFENILNSADIALPDGVGVSLGAWLTGRGYTTRITGVNFVESLCETLSKDTKKPHSVGFFGGLPGVAEKTAECLQKKYFGLKVSYASDAWDVEKIKGKNIDVLFVAMGCPAQEKWIYNNLDKIPVKVAMGVGGSFDFISGNVPRAPKFFQKVGLEWFYRLAVQPWRWKRQLALIRFSFLVFKKALHV